MGEYIERVPFAGLIEYLDKKEPCKNCYHRAACDAWARNATTLYDDYLYSVENCPYYKPAADVVPRSKWISVEERLPEKSGKYLVCTKNGNVYQTKFYSYPENAGGHWGQKDKGKSITHWMPLPDAPKGENNG